MPYTVRRKTIWLATPKSFYQKTREVDIAVPVYEFRSWRMPVNIAYALLREGYALQEETAAAWALDHVPSGGILRGITRNYMHTFPNDCNMEDVLEYTKAHQIRDDMTKISTRSYREPLKARRNSSGCREFRNYQNWYEAAAMTAVN